MAKKAKKIKISKAKSVKNENGYSVSLNCKNFKPKEVRLLKQKLNEAALAVIEGINAEKN